MRLVSLKMPFSPFLFYVKAIEKPLKSSLQNSHLVLIFTRQVVSKVVQLKPDSPVISGIESVSNLNELRANYGFHYI
jgi:hypothetical protein